MDKAVIFRAAAAGAILAFIGVIAQATAGASLPIESPAQPGIPMPIDQFVWAGSNRPETTLGFFGADSVFVLGYLMVFVGLYCATREQARPFALLGLGAGVFTALMDSTENGAFILLGQAAKNGYPLPFQAGDIPPGELALLMLTHLKWMGAFATLLAFGLVFPRRTRTEWVIAGLMLLFPVVGVMGIANTGLIAVRGLFFLMGMPLFAWYFWRQSRDVGLQ